MPPTRAVRTKPNTRFIVGLDDMRCQRLAGGVSASLIAARQISSSTKRLKERKRSRSLRSLRGSVRDCITEVYRSRSCPGSYSAVSQNGRTNVTSTGKHSAGLFLEDVHLCGPPNAPRELRGRPTCRSRRGTAVAAEATRRRRREPATAVTPTRSEKSSGQRRAHRRTDLLGARSRD